MLSSKQIADSVLSQFLDDIDVFAAAVIASSRIAFGVFVCENRARCFHDSLTGVIL